MKKIKLNNIYIWGTGIRSTQLNELNFSELNYLDIKGYIDNNEEKWGNLFYGKRIYSPAILNSPELKNIYIPNKFREEIIIQINKDFPNANVNIINEDLIKRVQIIQRYEKDKDKEISEIINYLIENPLSVFNYPFVNKYYNDDYQVYFDYSINLYYVIFQEKRMYFSREYDTECKVKNYYKSILLEQDDKSPHLYLSNNYEIERDAVVVDAGVAEGNFSLSIIDKVKKIYLFEPDKNWCEALQYTFAPYKDKIHIINKALSNYENAYITTIDAEVPEKIDLIKMDVEGEELYALQGAINHIKESTRIKCLVCTYHQEFAYNVIKDFLEENEMKIETSYGYMWYPDNSFRAPVLRRGLIRAKKED